MKTHVFSLTLLVFLCCMDTAAAQTRVVLVDLNEAVATLTGPWRFHVGDNPLWAEAAFDDSDWESMDLSAPAGATDGDVGLPNYAAGWSAKGHPGYYGYAWYRIHLNVRAPGSEPLALLGPWEVDSTYQIYANGRLLGGVGDFSGTTPTAHGYHYPRFFALPPAARSSLVIAIRVWMGPWEMDDPGSGGIHIAPAIGERDAIAAQYHLQWLTIFAGYGVDAVPALLFFLAAMMVLCLQPFDRGGRTLFWMATALTLSGIQRGNQPFFFWLEIETVREFTIFIIVIAGSLSLGAWMMAWRAWLKVTQPPWLPTAVAALTSLLIMAGLLGQPWLLHVTFPHWATTSVDYFTAAVRLAFLLTFLVIAYQGVRRDRHEGRYALPAMLAIGAVLFSRELGAAHVPGTWFPWGVGVSLSEYASVAFVLLFFVLLVRRLRSYAELLQRRRLSTVDA